MKGKKQTCLCKMSSAHMAIGLFSPHEDGGSSWGYAWRSSLLTALLHNTSLSWGLSSRPDRGQSKPCLVGCFLFLPCRDVTLGTKISLTCQPVILFKSFSSVCLWNMHPSLEHLVRHSLKMFGKVSHPRSKVTVDVFHDVGLSVHLAHLRSTNLPPTLCLMSY